MLIYIETFHTTFENLERLAWQIFVYGSLACQTFSSFCLWDEENPRQKGLAHEARCNIQLVQWADNTTVNALSFQNNVTHNLPDMYAIQTT